MKKFLLLLVALALSAPGFAQTAPAAPLAPAGSQMPTQRPPKTPEQTATRRTTMMAKKLGITPDQQAKVYQILLAQAQETQADKAGASSRKGLHQEMKSAHAKYEAQLQGVLTPAQYSQLMAIEQAHKAQHQRRAVAPQP